MASILEMMGHIQSEGERGKQAGLSRLIGKAYNDPSQRQAALGRVAQFDGPAAFNAQAMFEKMDDRGRQRLGQRMAVFSALPDDIKAQAYPDIAREAQALGIPAPGEWNPEFAPHMQKIAQALTQGEQGGTNVHSAFRGQNGNMWVLGRDGQVRDTGAQFDPNNQIMDTGNGIFGINKSNLQAAPVMVGGAPQQQAPSGPMTAATGQRVNIDPSLPENVRASIMAAENAGQPLPGVMVGEGQPDPQNIPTSMGMPAFQGAPGGQLRSAPKPQDQARLAMEAERLRLAQEAAARAADASTRGSIPQGYRMKADGSGLEPIPGAPVTGSGNKPLPVQALKADLEIEDALGAAEGVFAMSAKHLDRMARGELVVGTPEAAASKVRTFLNMPTDNDVALNELKADRTSIVNASLRLNKGVQTEGDAQRAVNELMSADDHKTTLAAFKRLVEINKRAVELQKRKRALLYQNYGKGQQQSAPATGGVLKWNPATGDFE